MPSFCKNPGTGLKQSNSLFCIDEIRQGSSVLDIWALYIAANGFLLQGVLHPDFSFYLNFFVSRNLRRSSRLNPHLNRNISLEERVLPLSDISTRKICSWSNVSASLLGLCVKCCGYSSQGCFIAAATVVIPPSPPLACILCTFKMILVFYTAPYVLFL